MSKVDGIGRDAHDIEVDGVKMDNVEWFDVAAASRADMYRFGWV